MKNTHVYLCDDSLEGVFTAIYDAWDSRYGHEYNKVVVAASDYNQEFFSEYIPVTTDMEKAAKVASGIRNRISPLFFNTIHRAAASYEDDKADVIYRSLILGFRMGEKALDHMSDPSIMRLIKLHGNVGGEINHWYGFLRFVELKNRVLFAKINPKNNLIPLIAPHFADRFPEENWVIADTTRNLMAFHQRSVGCMYASIDDVDLAALEGEYSETELEIQQLWKHFVCTIGIESRTNAKLQRQMLPLRFRKYMPDFS